MAKKELKIEVGEALYDAIAYASSNITVPQKLKVEVKIGAKDIKISNSTLPNKIEIDLSEELKGYIHEIIHIIKDCLKSKEKSIKEINELKDY